ncbi:MAG: type IV pilus assembly protein PilM [bacterium]|nr:type IV pilus assembly protein PilM [bacterium]
MAKSPLLVIDIGQNRVKVMELAPASKNRVKVVKMGSEALQLGPKAEQGEIYQRLQEVLPLLLQSLGVKNKRAIVSLPGRAAFTRRLQVPVVRGRQLDRIIRYEARQHVPFPLEEINMDYQVGKQGEEASELEVNLVAVRREIADGYVKIVKKCGVRTDIIEAAPLSIYNAYAASAHRDVEEVTAVISVGASSTDIVIEQNGRMQFMRSAPTAGNHLTELLIKKHNIEADKAETLKRKSADQYTESDELNPEDVALVLEQGFEHIVTEIQRSFDFYVSQPHAMPVTRVFLCGGTVNMEGASEFLEDRLGVPVTILDATDLETVETPAEYKDALRREAGLMGMAVRAAGQAPCALSFAPSAVKQRLELERRSPLLILMAVLLAAMLGGSVYALDNLVQKKRQAAEQMKQIISPGETASPRLKEQREIQEKYNNRYARIFNVAKKRGVLSRIYLEVQEMIPQDIWLDSIDLKSDRLSIVGRALNDARISTYMQNLALSPFFDNDTVVLRNAVFSTDSSAGSPQVDFTIEIVGFNEPTQAEIKFVDEFRSRMQDTPILAIRVIRPGDDSAGAAPSGGMGGYGGAMGGPMGGMGAAPASSPATMGAGAEGEPEPDATLLIGVYQMDDQNERLALMNKINAALNAASFSEIKTIELRFHGRVSDERERILIDREQLARFGEGSLGPEEFEKSFTLVTPSPSPTPTPTPTPDLSEEGESTGGGYGMYGMGMYGMGGYGMMGGGMMGGAPAAGQ